MPTWPFFNGSHSSTIKTPPSDADSSAYYFSPARSNTAAHATSSADTHGQLAIAHEVSIANRQLHGRSLSASLPGMIRGLPKRVPIHNNLEALPTRKPSGQPVPSPRRRIGVGGKYEDEELAHGRCATCEFKCKWPRGATEFTCISCSMINDIASDRGNAAQLHDRDPYLGQSEGHAGSRPLDQGTPLSISHTRSIIERCVVGYIDGNIGHTPNAEQPQRHLAQERFARYMPEHSASPTGIKDSSGSRSAMPFTAQFPAVQKIPAALDLNSTLPIPRRKSPALPSREAPQAPGATTSYIVDDSSQEETQLQPQDLSRQERFQFPFTGHSEVKTHAQRIKNLFEPLEEYIKSSFERWDNLNSSFQRQSSSRDADKTQRKDTMPRVAVAVPKSSPVPRPSAPQLSDLDAKTLLLGDVAENGLWWTGSEVRTRSASGRAKKEQPSPSMDLITPKSPRVNWPNVHQWYTMVLAAGTGWREMCLNHAGIGTERDFGDAEVTAIERDLYEARLNVQRCLLRASEELLKRPRTPLNSPANMRCLLILLANPLLSSELALFPQPLSTVAVAPSPSPVVLASNERLAKGNVKSDSADSRRNTLHVTNVLKRILGIISNMPNECHRNLTSWLARYHEVRFREIVALVQKFVSFRLQRHHGRTRSGHVKAVGLIPNLSGSTADTTAQLHAAIGLGPQHKAGNESTGQRPYYCDDWQIKAAARVLAILFSANKTFLGDQSVGSLGSDRHSISRNNIRHRGQLLSTSDFYSPAVDLADLSQDFVEWESAQGRFTFCQYPFFLSVGAKIRIMEHDAKRKMESKAREAFFNSILKNKAMEQYLILKVRRECLVEDSMKSISAIVGTSSEDIKKGLKVQFIGEEGIDGGGLRKEWFLLLAREIFDPQNGMFLYDEDSKNCYFNPHTFEPSDQFFLVGALLGLAIYNSTILDVSLPPILFKKLLWSGLLQASQGNTSNRGPLMYTLEDLAEYRPSLAKGLQQLLDFNGDVQETFLRSFVIDIPRYGNVESIPLCPNGENRAVTNSNRHEFVALYVRFLLETQVIRQFEPFKRGFLTVCGGNALSLFQPEEIELLIRGSEEQLDVATLKGVAIYANWRRGDRIISDPATEVNLIQWFWEFLEEASPANQRKVLSFITGSDRIPAMGTSSLIIKIVFAGKDNRRYPIARTCFNMLSLYKYGSKEELMSKLWTAVTESEGFGLR